jgi:two-component system response regulator FixJ
MKPKTSVVTGSASVAPATVYILDFDPEYRTSVRGLMESVKLRALEIDSGIAFLEHYDSSQPACLILELRLPDMSGLDVLRKLNSLEDRLPAIILTAFATVRTAVAAMQLGAVDVLEKPHQPHELLEKVQHALQQEQERCSRHEDESDLNLYLQYLTPREQQVLNSLLQGHSAKQIASELQITVRTVDFHRRNLLEKMQVDNVVQLTHIVHKFQFRETLVAKSK